MSYPSFSNIQTTSLEMIQDKTVQELLNSLQHYRNVDSVVMKLSQGVSVQPAEVINAVLKDRVTDYRTSQILNCLLMKRNKDKLETGLSTSAFSPFVPTNVNAGRDFDFEIIRKADELIKQNKVNVASARGLKPELPLAGLSSSSGLNQYGWNENYWAGVSPQVSGVYGLGYEKYVPGFNSCGIKGVCGNVPIGGFPSGINNYDLFSGGFPNDYAMTGSAMNPMFKQFF